MFICVGLILHCNANIVEMRRLNANDWHQHNDTLNSSEVNSFNFEESIPYSLYYSNIQEWTIIGKIIVHALHWNIMLDLYDWSRMDFPNERLWLNNHRNIELLRTMIFSPKNTCVLWIMFEFMFPDFVIFLVLLGLGLTLITLIWLYFYIFCSAFCILILHCYESRNHAELPV
jgi:hypothetical protein